MAQLLAEGADVDCKGEYGFTPLHFAAVQGHTGVAKLLLAKGADIHARSSVGDTPLHSAAEAGQPDMVEYLIAEGANINARKHEGWTPLYQAVNGCDWQPSCSEAVRVLVAHGADPNIRGTGHFPLQLAAQIGDAKIVELLLDHSADINARGFMGRTALEVATRNGHVLVADVLKRRGAIMRTGCLVLFAAIGLPWLFL